MARAARRKGRIDESMERIEDCLSFLVGKAAQQVARRTREALAPLGVTPVQFAVLHVLWERDGQNRGGQNRGGHSGTELGARLAMDSATVTGVVDRLEAAGLVTRRRDPGGDRRVQTVALTRRGREARGPLVRAVDALNAEIRGELGGDLEVALAVLGRLGRLEERERDSDVR
jgi:DNA-binding MarR family transcriptional regulator